MDASFHCFDGAGDNAIVRSLIEAGIALTPSAAADCPGLVFFKHASAPLVEMLHDWSRHGLVRVLAVAESSEGLAGNAVWQLMAAGAADVFCWDRCADPVRDIKARLERWRAVDELVESALVRESLVGCSPPWKRTLRLVVEAARFSDSSILILGESGTGKELVARLIHTLDPRPTKTDLIVLDCTTIVPELAGSELFGHERGAFTHALSARSGVFALANGGSLLLDEIGELPLPLQAQLLRSVQERVYKRVGGSIWQKTNFRLVCATNRDLTAAVDAGQFRQDLYYRIASCVVKLPPLRERTTDIIPLTRHFLRECRGASAPPLDLDPTVRAYLLEREYPGNVRDLRRIVHRIASRHVGAGPITPGDIPDDERPATPSPALDWRDEGFDDAICRALNQGVGLKAIGRAAEDAAVRVALHEENGNLRRAAKRLEVTGRALQMRRAAWRRVTAAD